jgi:hypothetical protein
MLVFEEPEAPVVWLARATPRPWLEQGRRIAVTSAPTRFGKLSYEVRSDMTKGRISASVTLPDGFSAATRLRLRVPGERKIKAVSVNGAPWTDFDVAQEAVTIPPGHKGPLKIEVSY